MKVLTTGWNTFHETGKYTCATVEYMGLFSYSVVKRGGLLVTGSVRTVARPVAKVVTWPFEFACGKTTGIFTSKKQKEKIRGLEEKLMDLDQRLTSLEKYGLAPVPEDPLAKKEKDLPEDKRFVLQQILQNTKSIREGD